MARDPGSRMSSPLTPPAECIARQTIHVEWDEPGAGSIVVNGERLVSFNIPTDWSDAWNPAVNEKAMRFLDSLPRLFQEVENAYDTARRYEAEALAAIETGGPA